MRISIKNLNQKQRIALICTVVLTFPVSVPLIGLLAWRRKSRKNRAKGVKSTAVADLRNKLWQGFGQTTSAAITTYLAEGRYSRKDRAELAYELARWQAAQGNWEQSLDLLTQASELNGALANRPEPAALLIETQSRLGQLDAAQATLDRAKTILNPTEYALAKSNLLLLQNGQSADVQRLALLNEVYANAGLQPVVLIDPNGPLDMDNLVGHDITPFYGDEKVTVIIPVFEAAAHLDTALRGVCEQSYRNLEIIVIDDASGDNSWEIIQGYAAKDDRIIALQNAENSGAYKTRNRGLQQATGHYVTVHDSDDWSHPQMIQRQLEKLRFDQNKGVFGTSIRLTGDLFFALDLPGQKPKFTNRCYPALVAGRQIFLELGGWDEVRIAADDEMVRRIRSKYGSVCIGDCGFIAPMTMQRQHFSSLTQNSTTSITSNTFGLRRTYFLQADHWRSKQAMSDLAFSTARENDKTPFPIPNLMLRSCEVQKKAYDLILISDFGLPGGTRRCNEAYIAAATKDGLRVGLYNYPRWDLPTRDVSTTYLNLCLQDNVDLLTKEDVVRTKAVLIHHPPIMKYRMDALPSIDTKLVGVLVNQCPMQLKSERPWLYSSSVVTENCNFFFGQDPLWIPISDIVRERLNAIDGYNPIYEENWLPPFTGEILYRNQKTTSGDMIRIGRHSRDHWTKWPATSKDLVSAYCANASGIKTYFLGGADKVPNTLNLTPSNWTTFDFDSLPVNDFLDTLDVFVNFMHHDYIEEFGRNTMEAMARGKPVLLEHGLVDTFGDAALYCDPDEVEQNVRRLMSDPALYQAQADKGLEFVRRNCSEETARRNLRSLIDRADSTDAA